MVSAIIKEEQSAFKYQLMAQSFLLEGIGKDANILKLIVFIFSVKMMPNYQSKISEIL